MADYGRRYRILRWVAEITSKFAFYIQRSFLDFGKHCALVHSHPVQFVKDLLLALSAEFEPFNRNAGDRTAIEVFCHAEEEKSNPPELRCGRYSAWV